MADALILTTYPGYKREDIRKMSVREYNELLEQVFNVTNFKLGGKLKNMTAKDEEKLAEEQLERRLKSNKRRK